MKPGKLIQSIKLMEILMSEIYYTLIIKGVNRTSPPICAFLDTGSAFNVIRYDLPGGLPTVALAKDYNSQGSKDVELIGYEESQTLPTVMFESITIGGLTITDPKFTSFSLAKIGDEAIIGYPLMQYLEMVIDFRKGKEGAKIYFEN